MTVPVQRGNSAGGQADPTVLGILVETTRRIEDSLTRGFAAVDTQLSRMPNDYVPRHEIDRRFDDVTGDVDRLAQRMDAAERARVTGRRWALGFSTTLAAVLIALLSLILANLPG